MKTVQEIKNNIKEIIEKLEQYSNRNSYIRELSDHAISIQGHIDTLKELTELYDEHYNLQIEYLTLAESYNTLLGEHLDLLKESNK